MRAKRAPCRKEHNDDPASAAEARVSDASCFDELEEIELVATDAPELKPAADDGVSTALKPGAPTESSASAASSCVHSSLPTTTDQRATPFIESPRQPQHVKFGLTSEERRRMKEMFPDMKKIRAEFLASLTPEERAMVEENALA